MREGESAGEIGRIHCQVLEFGLSGASSQEQSRRALPKTARPREAVEGLERRSEHRRKDCPETDPLDPHRPTSTHLPACDAPRPSRRQALSCARGPNDGASSRLSAALDRHDRESRRTAQRAAVLVPLPACERPLSPSDSQMPPHPPPFSALASPRLCDCRDRETRQEDPVARGAHGWPSPTLFSRPTERRWV